MQPSHKIIADYLALTPHEQVAFLRHFNQNLDAELCDFFLCIVRDLTQDNALRKEAMNVIGLFKSKEQDRTVKNTLFYLLRSNDTSDIKQQAINTLALMNIDDNDILFAAHLVQANSEPSLQQAALAFIAQHSALPSAKQALQQLADSPSFHPTPYSNPE